MSCSNNNNIINNQPIWFFLIVQGKNLLDR